MENANDILDFLLQRKAECIFVPYFDAEFISKYACALANQSGGTIIVGMHEDSNIVGVSNEDYTSISQHLVSDVTPTLPFALYTVQRDGKTIVIVSILEGAHKPYGIFGRFYVVSANTCQEVDASQMNRLFETKSIQDQNWERELVGDATIEDLDETVLARIKHNLVQDKKLSSESSAFDILKALGFMREGIATNAAIVVTGKQPSTFFPQTRIRVSVFGEDNQLEAIRLYDSSLVEAIDQIVDYIYSLYPEKLIIRDMERIKGETIPKVALREGILNACVHRIYDNYRSFVRVNVYPNQLEIINSGSLLQGIRIQDFGLKHNSMLRNPDIANAFFVLRYIEAAGSGTIRIIDECKKNECNPPKWEEADGCVKLIFEASRPVARRQITREMQIENLSSDPSIRASLISILNFLAEHRNAKNPEISALIGKSYATTKRYMQILKDSGLIEYIGSLKTGGWQLADQ